MHLSLETDHAEKRDRPPELVKESRLGRKIKWTPCLYLYVSGERRDDPSGHLKRLVPNQAAVREFDLVYIRLGIESFVSFSPKTRIFFINV